MAHIEKLSIFLASPGDVQEERQQVREVIEELNRGIAREKNIYLEIIGWDTDAFPAYGGDPQSIINHQIADMDKYDVFVGIMGNRFGMPTPRAGSGTEEELTLAITAAKQTGRPHIMFYFSQKPFTPSSSKEAEQKLKVLQFKEKIESEGCLTWGFNSEQNFRVLFQRHLSSWLTQRTAATPEPPVKPSGDSFPEATTTAIKPPKYITDSGMWVLLGEAFYLAEEIIENNDAVTLQLPSRNAADDSALKSLNSSPFQNGHVSYAHQNSAGIARVLSAERRSIAGKSLWAVSLQMVDTSRNSMFLDMGYNGISADEIAVLRARTLLLNELPSSIASSGNRTINDTLTFLALTNEGKLSEAIFPKLWQQFKGQTEYFLPLARLWAVYHLLTSRTCEHVLELTLGPLNGNRLQVYFRGRRHNIYTNQDAYIIEVKGECDLMPKS